jgi:hypothetical protein
VIAQRVGVAENTVRAIAKRFAETGGDVMATISRKPRGTPPVPPVVTGEVEARLIALVCSSPPPGRGPSGQHGEDDWSTEGIGRK